MIKIEHSRRDILRGVLATAGVERPSEFLMESLPARAQSETLVPFVDFPENFPTVIGADRRIIDVRRIHSWLTPPDQFFTTQHYGHPVISTVMFRLKVTGLADRPQSLSARGPATHRRHRPRRRIRVLGKPPARSGVGQQRALGLGVPALRRAGTIGA